jgi:HD-GYP domain-containing protein (c-di-GMP phosphodiesterase class II)
VHPEVQELQTKLKEILYDCAVEIRATKAALYLLTNDARFELITEYGFRGVVRPLADRTDPVVDRCGRGRTPFLINGLNTEPRFSHVMFESASDRLLGAPIYLRGNMVGFIDMRDKAAKAPFEAADLPRAQKIAERIAEQFANRNVFNQRFITLSEAPARATIVPPSMPVNEAKSAPVVDPSPPKKPAAGAKPSLWGAERSAPSNVPALSTLIIEARSNADRIAVPESPETIGEAELAVIRDLLRSMLLIPGAVVASVSAYGHMGGVQEIAARSSLTDEAVNVLQSKLNLWLTKRGDAGGFVRTNINLPFGAQDAQITAAHIQKVFTAPITAGSLRGLYLTVVFAATPDRGAHELLAAFHKQLQTAIEHSIERGAMQSTRARIADALVEPDFAKYPELRRHTDSVTARVEAFARFLSLSPADAETARIVAIVHDAGMRLLEYERLYRKKDLTADELSILKEHAAVGASIVEPLLGNEIARAVLCHHERWDGTGYPNEVHGAEIPLAARVVQICDVYETMIAADSYAPAEPLETAASKIARAAGTQFDPDLAQKFVDMLRAR